MGESQSIRIDGISYQVRDVLTVQVPDSFSINKLQPEHGNRPGHGEAKLYVGPESNREDIFKFFQNFGVPCFFRRSDLLSYLEDAETEYLKPAQRYAVSPGPQLKERRKTVGLLSEYPRLDLEPHEDRARVYIRPADGQNNKLWNLACREVPLPRISAISFYLLTADSGNIIYAKPILNDTYLPDYHPRSMEETLEELEEEGVPTETERQALSMARIGQGKFREKLIAARLSCPFTGVSNPTFLRAGHIKPWRPSDNAERLSPDNGLLMTPTYDMLFDRGYISFDEQGCLLVSPLVTEDVRKEFGLIPGEQYEIITVKKAPFMAYHRQYVFKQT